MKKIFIGPLFLILIISLTFTGSLFAAGKTLSIAMIQWRGETEACRGFKDKLKELGYSVRYTTWNAQQTRSRLGGLLRKELLPNLKNFDYIYSYGTTASKMTKSILNNRAPHVFSNVAAPVRSDIVKSLARSGENISGTTNRVPVSLQIDHALKIIRFKKIGIFFNPREKNSMLMRRELYESSKIYGFEIVDFRTPPVKDALQRALKSLNQNPNIVGAVYLPLDSFLITRAKEVGAALREAKIRSIGAQKKYMENGALLGIIPNYYKLGTKVAKVVDRHQKGEMLSDIPIQTVTEPMLMVNRATAKALDIKIPQELLGRVTFVD